LNIVNINKLLKKGVIFIKKIVIFTIVLILCMQTMTLAADFELDGGFLYTTFDSETLNDITNEKNEYYQNELDEKEQDPSVDLKINNFEQMEELDNATGYWLGLKSDYLKSKYGINYEVGFLYETFTNDVEVNLYAVDQSSPEYTKVKENLEIEVEGFAINSSREINDYFDIIGTVGYYSGEVSSYKRYETYTSSKNVVESTGSSDLGGNFGYKLGISTDYSISKSLSTIGNISYRFLELDIDNTNETIKFNGLNFKAGLSYRF